ncbi:uncharacterized protein DS421_5g157930 [Arachis hypogaea]|nr:uncharacterized protein DS421_5g157930 [Arachis hypogaea]
MVSGLAPVVPKPTSYRSLDGFKIFAVLFLGTDDTAVKAIAILKLTSAQVEAGVERPGNIYGYPDFISLLLSLKLIRTVFLATFEIETSFGLPHILRMEFLIILNLTSFSDMILPTML